MDRFLRVVPCLLLLLLYIQPAQAQLFYNYWDFSCEDNRAVDLVGTGMYQSPPNKMLNIPDPGTVLEVVVEAVCKNNCPPTVTFTAQQGPTTVAAIVQQFGTQGPFGAAKSYRAIFRGSTDTVAISGATGGQFYSFVTYVFRSNTGSRRQSTMGQFLDNFYYRYSQTLTFNLPAVNAPRDVKVTFPVSDMLDDNRIAEFAITAGSLTDTVVIATYDTTLGNSLAIVELELKDVPPSENILSVYINSPKPPAGDGDSFHAGVIVEAECPNRPPVAVNDINNTLVNVSVTGNVSTNDIDPDGDSTAVAVLSGTSNGSLALGPDGSYTYTPNKDFTGTDRFTYTVCESGPYALCDTATVTIKVIDSDANNNRGPVANDDATITIENVTVNGSLSNNDFDPDGDSIQTNTTPISGPSNGTISINGDGTFSYTPDSSFTGRDTVIYELCEVTNNPPALCDTARLVIIVMGDDNGNQNNPPFAGDDAFGVSQDSSYSGNLGPNDSDPNGDNLVYDTTAVSGPEHGSVTINPDGSFTYTPNPGYSGTDKFVYKVCDDGTPSLCTQATTYITVFPPATTTIQLKLWAYLEGAFSLASGKMSTRLNDLGFLPGQTPVGLFPTPTPAGQPYNTIPWNYNGTEGDNYGDGPGKTPYPATVTDWILVSVREGNPSPTAEVYKTAALLHDDGRVEFVGEPFKVNTSNTNPFYVVLEHRNHIGVMTPSAITPSVDTAGDYSVFFDFRIQNSYVELFTFGQKQLAPNTFVLYGGDPQKAGNENFEINGNDNTVWLNDNGKGEIYLNSDFNLDTEINGTDNSFWLQNNGIASGVPK